MSGQLDSLLGKTAWGGRPFLEGGMHRFLT